MSARKTITIAYTAEVLVRAMFAPGACHCDPEDGCGCTK